MGILRSRPSTLQPPRVFSGVASGYKGLSPSAYQGNGAPFTLCTYCGGGYRGGFSVEPSGLVVGEFAFSGVCRHDYNEKQRKLAIDQVFERIDKNESVPG